jgi:hypothetical protein
MKAETRVVLDMGARVRDHGRSHPSPDASYTGVVDSLESLLTTGNALAAQQRDGLLTVAASAARKGQVLNEMHDGVRHLVDIGQVASKQVPELAERFQLPDFGLPQLTVITAIRGLVSEARAQQDLFIRSGLSSTVLDDLDRGLKEFDEAQGQRRAGRAQHVNATGQLEQVTRKITEVVGTLDALNRYRYREDPAQLITWESARNVDGGGRKARAAGAVKADGADGAVKPDAQPAKPPAATGEPADGSSADSKAA